MTVRAASALNQISRGVLLDGRTCNKGGRRCWQARIANATVSATIGDECVHATTKSNSAGLFEIAIPYPAVLHMTSLPVHISADQFLPTQLSVTLAAAVGLSGNADGSARYAWLVAHQPTLVIPF